METFNDNFVSLIQGTILPIMENIGMFDYLTKDEDRGKYYFQTNEQGMILSLNLEITLES